MVWNQLENASNAIKSCERNLQKICQLDQKFTHDSGIPNWTKIHFYSPAFFGFVSFLLTNCEIINSKLSCYCESLFQIYNFDWLLIFIKWHHNIKMYSYCMVYINCYSIWRINNDMLLMNGIPKSKTIY